MFKYVILALLAAMAFFLFFFDIAFTNDQIGKLFVAGILGCLVLFLLFKTGLHYKILALNRFADAFYYSVFEYRKAQEKPSKLTYMESVREQAEVALAANFDPTLATADLKIPATLYSGKDPFLEQLRAKIQQAEKIKLEARHLDRKADVLIGKTKEELVEKDLADEKSGKLLDRIFDIENGVAAIIDLTVGELKDQGYDRAPDYKIITHIAFDNNPFFSRIFKLFDSEDVIAVLSRAPFMIILLGIIGTFAGFYLALNQGGDIKSGASVAIISSLVGLPVSLLMDHINTLFPDKSQYQQAFNKYKISLEMLFKHEQDLDKEQTALALEKSEQERLDTLAKQKAELEKRMQQEVAKTAQALKEQAEREAAKVKKEIELALEKAEQERVGALAKQKVELEKQRKLAVAKKERELRAQAEREAAALIKENEHALEKAEQERVIALTKQEADLEKQRQLEVARAEQALKAQAERETAKLKKEKELAIEKAEKERLEALAKQEADLDKQKQLEVAKTAQKLRAQAEHETAKLRKEKELAAEKAEKQRLEALAKQEAELEKKKQLEVAKKEQELRAQAEREAAKLRKENELAIEKAEQERLDALAKKDAELEKQRQLEVAKKERELRAQAEREAAELKKENELALAEAQQKHQSELAAQKSALEEEKAKALSEKERAFTEKLNQQKKLLAKVAEEFAGQS